tara:strand:+ start:773 stop:1246 length:474 start_codon:yes stop_codon:yes gene_type:complete
MSNFIATEKAILKIEADALRIKIENNPMPLAESEAACLAVAALLSHAIGDVENMTDAEKESFRKEWSALAGKGEKATDTRTLEGYERTLSLDLVHCPHRYVVASDCLESPAGFHPDTRVFVQPTIMINTSFDVRMNENKHLIPNSNVTLYFTDLEAK